MKGKCSHSNMIHHVTAIAQFSVSILGCIGIVQLFHSTLSYMSQSLCCHLDFSDLEKNRRVCFLSSSPILLVWKKSVVLYSCMIDICIEDVRVHEKSSVLEGIIFFLCAWLYHVKGVQFVIWWTYYLFMWDKSWIIGF